MISFLIGFLAAMSKRRHLPEEEGPRRHLVPARC